MKKKLLYLCFAVTMVFGWNIIQVSAGQSTVKVTKPKQVVDQFQGVDALYRPGGSDGSDTTYSCAALVKRYYSKVYGKTPYNLLYNCTPVIDGGVFKKTASPAAGDIVGYPNASRKCNHWAIVQKVSGSKVVLLEQNWKWTEGKTTYAVSDHEVGVHSSVGNNKGYGKAVYFRYYPNNSNTGKKPSASSAVTAKKQTLTLNKSNVSVKTYFTYQLKAVIGNKRPGDSVIFTSSHPKIASVSSLGTIKGLRTGTTYITAKIKGTSISKTCKVTVTYGPRIISLKASRLTFVKVKQFALKGTIYNKRASDKLKYKTSNKKVATVTSKGVVKKKKKGTAVITAWIPGTNTKKTCKVTVK